MAVRWRLRAWRSIHILITTPDEPPKSDWLHHPGTGGVSQGSTLLIEQCRATEERYRVI